MTTSRSTPHRAAPWLLPNPPLPSPRLRLFCLPFAGGTAQVYAGWGASLPPGVEVCAAQLPGRGTRFSEPLFTRMEPLLDELEAALAPLTGVPFAFFGHSLGSIVAFELARRLLRAGGPQPMHLFVSGRRAPPIPGMIPPRYNLPDKELLAELRRMGGTPEQVLREPELMALMLPMIRADFTVIDTWRYEPDERLYVPLTAFAGLDDTETPRAQMEAWAQETRGEFDVHMLPGGHFFLQSARAELLELISRTLSRSTIHHF